MKLRPLRAEGGPLSAEEKQLLIDVTFHELEARSIYWRDFYEFFHEKDEVVYQEARKLFFFYSNLWMEAVYVINDQDKALDTLLTAINQIKPIEPKPTDFLLSIERATEENISMIANCPLQLAAQIEKFCLWEEEKMLVATGDYLESMATYLLDKSYKSYSIPGQPVGQTDLQSIYQSLTSKAKQQDPESMTTETFNTSSQQPLNSSTQSPLNSSTPQLIHSSTQEPLVLTEHRSIDSFRKPEEYEEPAAEADLSDEELEKTLDNIFKVRTAEEWFDEAATMPELKPLYKTLWIEGEISCLFADTNIGKSILAVQIAEEIAKKKKVLYFDFEMSTKQFERRYTNEEGVRHTFDKNFKRVELQIENLTPEYELEDIIIKAIERLAIKSETSTIIIDNLTYLCNDNASGDLAGRLMMRLVELKKLHGWSILVLAHTPKRALDSPLTQNDLAGSKKLINFFDSAFAIGKSASDESMRYLKHIKSRWGEKEYSAENVLRMEITTDDNWLHFEERGTIEEDKLLKKPDEKDREAKLKRIQELHREGLSNRKIGQQVGLSHVQVMRLLKKMN